MVEILSSGDLPLNSLRDGQGFGPANPGGASRPVSVCYASCKYPDSNGPWWLFQWWREEERQTIRYTYHIYFDMFKGPMHINIPK